MATIAVYNLKGGVGKTSIAVNLAATSATVSRRRTLLWDLDPQGGATFVLRGTAEPRIPARTLFSRGARLDALARPTMIGGLELVAADISLRGLDRLLLDLGKKRRLLRLLEEMGGRWDHVMLDCPPGLSDTAEQVMRAADIIVVPVVPSPLSQRAFDAVVAHVDRLPGRRAAILPVHNMVDRRRVAHREALEAQPDWPIIPMTSAMEASSGDRTTIGTFAPRSPGAAAIARLWTGIERRVAAAPRPDSHDPACVIRTA